MASSTGICLVACRCGDTFSRSRYIDLSWDALFGLVTVSISDICGCCIYQCMMRLARSFCIISGWISKCVLSVCMVADACRERIMFGTSLRSSGKYVRRTSSWRIASLREVLMTSSCCCNSFRSLRLFSNGKTVCWLIILSVRSGVSMWLLGVTVVLVGIACVLVWSRNPSAVHIIVCRC